MADGAAPGEAVLTGIRPSRCRTGDVYFTSRSAGHGIRPRVGHSANAASRFTAGGCATAARFADVEPGLKAVDGSDLPISMPSAGIGEGRMCMPIRPSLGGRSRSSSPVREGQRRPVTDSSRSCSAMPNGPTASRSATGCSAASKRHSNRLPAQGQPEAGKGARPRRRDGRSPSRRPGGTGAGAVATPNHAARRSRRRTHLRNRRPRPAVIGGRRENSQRNRKRCRSGGFPRGIEGGREHPSPAPRLYRG